MILASASQGQRSEPTTSNPFSGFGFGGGQGAGGGGFHMSFGIGAFPFGFFATNFNFGEDRPGAPSPGSHQATEEAFLHKVFLWVSIKSILKHHYHSCSSGGFCIHILVAGCLRLDSISKHWRLSDQLSRALSMLLG